MRSGQLNASFRKRVLRGLASVAILGSLVVFVMMDREQAESASEKPNSVAALSDEEPNVPAVVPAVPVDPNVSLLGTDASISETEQRLILIATSPGKLPQSGTAKLGTDHRNPQTYAAGARLANGALLEEIHSDYVVLNKDGRQSLLLLFGKKSARLASVHRDIGVDSTVVSVGGEEAVNRPLEKFASSREDLSEIIRAQPYFERDEYAGLKVLPGIHAGKLTMLELQAGDIVRTIEGRRTKSADAAWQLLDDAISTGTPIVVGIERDGSLMSISLDGSRLASSSVPPVMPPGF